MQCHHAQTLACLERSVIICAFVASVFSVLFPLRSPLWNFHPQDLVSLGDCAQRVYLHSPPVSITVFICALECFHDNTPAAKVRWYPTEAKQWKNIVCCRRSECWLSDGRFVSCWSEIKRNPWSDGWIYASFMTDPQDIGALCACGDLPKGLEMPSHLQCSSEPSYRLVLIFSQRQLCSWAVIVSLLSVSLNYIHISK